MRRFFYCVLLVLVLLPGCAAKMPTESPAQQIDLFYCRVEPAYGTLDGLLAAESCDWQVTDGDYLSLMQRYLEGPVSPELESPFPANAEFLDITVQSQCANVTVNAAIAALQGIDLTIALSAVSKTMLQFSEIQSVRFTAQNILLGGQESLLFTQESLVLYDDSAQSQQVSLKLYIPGNDGAYLIEQIEQINKKLSGSLPEYLLQRLKVCTEEAGQNVFPAQASVLDTAIENGVCTVDFSDEFLTEKPTTAQEERLLLFSIVNTLTGIDNIDAVRIIVAGEPVERYVYFDLSENLYRDTTMVKAEQQATDVFDATLCLPMYGQEGLFACSIQLKERRNEDRCRLVLDALLSCQTSNGYYNPIPTGTIIRAFSRENNICYLDFSSDPLVNCKTTEQMQQCIQSIVLSIRCSVTSCLVQITVNGIPLQQLHTLKNVYANYFVPEMAMLK